MPVDCSPTALTAVGYMVFGAIALTLLYMGVLILKNRHKERRRKEAWARRADIFQHLDEDGFALCDLETVEFDKHGDPWLVIEYEFSSLRLPIMRLNGRWRVVHHLHGLPTPMRLKVLDRHRDRLETASWSLQQELLGRTATNRS